MGLRKIVDTFTLLVSVVDKVMDLLPSYDQNKKKQFYSLRKKYEEEKSKNYPDRDDNLVGVLHDDLLRFMDVFKEELSNEK